MQWRLVYMPLVNIVIVSRRYINKIKARKTSKIRNPYNQIPQQTKDTMWEGDKTQLNITNKNQELSPFPAGDHKAAMNRRESMTNIRHLI